MAANNAYTVPALEKGLRILEDLAASSEPLSIAELAGKQGKSRNEIYRMLCCLDSLGYITREAATKRYSLSLKLFQMASRHPPLERLRLVAAQPIQELADCIRESCHLCVMDGNDLSVVSQASGSERIRIAFQLGARFDPLETCSGKLLLSELEPEARECSLVTSRIFCKASTTVKKGICQQLEKPAKQRLWEEDSLLRPGVRDIAVALGAPDTIHATIAVAHLTYRGNARSIRLIRRAVTAAAQNIEQQLGLTA